VVVDQLDIFGASVGPVEARKPNTSPNKAVPGCCSADQQVPPIIELGGFDLPK
jgi:hypothetical protein